MRQEEKREKEEREVENLKEEELTRASGKEYGTRETNKRQKELP